MIRIASQEEAEECEYLVCARFGTPSPFTDNLTDKCCSCGSTVIHRPHAPKKPARICMECMIEMGEATKQ